KGFVAIHGPLISSLKGGNRMDPLNKMSKSKADSAIFIHDSPEEIERKIKGAFCPEGVVEGNPIMQIYKNIIFNFYPNKLNFGESRGFKTYKELEESYVRGEIKASELKEKLAYILIDILKPTREYFSKNSELSALMEEFK
ncbi:MAG: tyrosine--tRNA ligase, partial [Thermoplasmatales archaeon]